MGIGDYFAVIWKKQLDFANIIGKTVIQWHRVGETLHLRRNQVRGAAVGENFLDAFEGAILRGESLSDVLKGLGCDLAGMALNEIKTNGFGGILNALGGLFGGGTLANSQGNVFAGGRSLTEFAHGGALTNAIVNRPTLFPMAKGMGLMGEAGAEAVVPLTRMSSGDLGVQNLPRVGAGAAPQDEVKRAA